MDHHHDSGDADLPEAKRLRRRVAELEAAAAERGEVDELLRIQRDLGIALGSAATPADAFRCILEAALRIDGIECGAIYLVEEDTGSIELAAHVGLSAAFVEGTLRYHRDTLQARTVRDGKPVYGSQAEIPPELFDVCRGEGIRSVAVIPVRHMGRSVACLNLASLSEERIGPFAREALEALSVQVGSVIARVRAEERTRAGEERYRLLAENVTDCIWKGEFSRPWKAERLADRAAAARFVDQRLAEFRFSYFSPSVQTLLGYSADEAVRLRLEDLLSPDALAVVWSMLEEDLVGGDFGPSTRQSEWVAKDGSSRVCEVTANYLFGDRGRIVGVLGVTRDLTDRLRTQMDLAASEAKLRCLFENLPDFVILVDDNGIIQSVNRGAGPYSAEDLLGRSGFSFMKPEYQEACGRALRRAIATEQNQKVECLDTFGQVWESCIVPLPVQPGGLRQLMVIGTDITARRRAEESLHHEQQNLRRLLDMHERDRKLVAYEIHDGLAQPMAGAVMQLEGFLARQPSDRAGELRGNLSPVVEMLRNGLAEARRLMSGLRSTILDDFGIAAALENLVFDSRRKEGPEIEYAAEAHFGRLAAPVELALFRTVQEALANARRHSHASQVRIRLVQEADWVRVEIEDDGVGFDPAVSRPNHFGLEGIRERARLLGGRAAIQSSPGQGTRIAVELPLVECDPVDKEPTTG